MWRLKHIRRFLTEIGEDLKDVPAPQFPGLRKFVDPDVDEWDGGDSEGLIGEIAQKWPHLVSLDTGAPDADGTPLITPSRISLIKRFINESRVYVCFYQLSYFIGFACHELRDSELEIKRGIEAPSSTQLIAKVWGAVKFNMQSRESMPPIPPYQQIGGSAAIHKLHWLAKRLAEITEASRAMQKQLRDEFGNAVEVGTPGGHWEDYANAIDTGSAQLAWMKACRHQCAYMEQSTRGVTDQLEELSEFLKSLEIEKSLGIE